MKTDLLDIVIVLLIIGVAITIAAAPLIFLIWLALL